MDGIMTVMAASKVLKVPYGKVYYLLNTKKVLCEKLGREWMITPAAFVEIKTKIKEK